MFEDEAIVDKTSPQNDRPDEFTLHLNLLEYGFHRNAIVVYRQFHERPGILYVPKLSSSSVLTQRMFLLKIMYGFVAVVYLTLFSYFYLH